MKDIDNKSNFINLMEKVEKVGHILLNQQSVMKDSRQTLSVPEPFRGFMNSHNLV